MYKLEPLKKAVVLTIASVLVAALGSGTVLAVENGGIGGKPANPRADNPRSQSIFVYELKPGERVDDAVKVVNNTDKSKTLLVYGVDSQTSSDGAFACAQKADSPVGVANWIKLSREKVTLAPNSSENVAFTLTVPETASAGEQNGCIVIQDSEQVPSPQGNGVTLSFRSAIRVAVTVPGDITKQLDFSGPVAVKVSGDTVQFSVGLKNNGNVSLDTEINARLANIFGATTRSAGGTFPVLARSQAVFNFEVKKPFWGGLYAAGATATYGDELEQSLGESGHEAAVDSPKKWIFISPAPLALAIELAVLALITAAAAAWLVRKRRYKKLHAESTLHVAKKGESLQSVAKKHGVSWKVVAKLNKLKPPYHIEPGQELKIPATTKADPKHDSKAASE